MKLYKPYTRKQFADLASFCNRNGMIIEDKGDFLESVLPPPPPPPTNEEQRQARANAYVTEIDPLHSQKQRRTILGTWTDEDEAEYVEKVKTLSEDINNRYPYMENEEQTSPAKDADVQDSEYGEVSDLTSNGQPDGEA